MPGLASWQPNPSAGPEPVHAEPHDWSLRPVAGTHFPLLHWASLLQAHMDDPEHAPLHPPLLHDQAFATDIVPGQVEASQLEVASASNMPSPSVALSIGLGASLVESPPNPSPAALTSREESSPAVEPSTKVAEESSVHRPVHVEY